MTASNEGVVAWQMRSIRLAPDGSNFNWLDCSKESHDSINDDRYSPYEARALVPATALTALQAELDAANAKCAALIKENTAAEAIIWRKVDEAESEHAALLAGVEGLQRYDVEIEGDCECCGTWTEAKAEAHGYYVKWGDISVLLAGRE
jgi:hypothetical protein